MALKKSQQSMKSWADDDYVKKGSVYVPRKQAERMSDRETARVSAIKDRATAAGEQYAQHGLHKGKKR